MVQELQKMLVAGVDVCILQSSWRQYRPREVNRQWLSLRLWWTSRVAGRCTRSERRSPTSEGRLKVLKFDFFSIYYFVSLCV